jgi:8-oxo-dGTP diphosphatase
MDGRPASEMESALGFEDWYRISVHAVVTNPAGEVLLLAATYGEKAWGLPGGALDPGETIHDGLRRECAEELGCDIEILYLSGVYAHSSVRSHAFIFRCALPVDGEVQLSSEHSAYGYFPVAELPPVQRRRVIECMDFTGEVRSASF